jgi:phosphatidate cytidylyltransferase
VGRRFGKRQLAPRISPKKTVEGLAGGVVVAVAVGAVLGNFGPFELTDGLLLGAIVAVAGPLGDLAVSVVKRAIGVKDMGAILPGHGGVLDRIDAMIFVIPAAWVVYSWMGLIVG